MIDVIKDIVNILGELYNSQEIVGVDLEKILRVLTNISEYLYNKYGEYSNIGKEVENMVTTLDNPVNLDTIAKFTGLSTEELNKVKQEFDRHAQ